MRLARFIERMTAHGWAVSVEEAHDLPRPVRALLLVTALDASTPRAAAEGRTAKRRGATRGSKKTCRSCGGIGHNRRGCPLNKMPEMKEKDMSGRSGGLARAASLSPEQRSAISRQAAAARWADTPSEADDATELRAALAAHGGHVGATAEALGVSRATLDRRIAALGIREWLRTAYPYPRPRGA
jgi:DNA-binding NtrC family response regulator